MANSEVVSAHYSTVRRKLLNAGHKAVCPNFWQHKWRNKSWFWLKNIEHGYKMFGNMLFFLTKRTSLSKVIILKVLVSHVQKASQLSKFLNCNMIEMWFICYVSITHRYFKIYFLFFKLTFIFLFMQLIHVDFKISTLHPILFIYLFI